MENPFNPFQPQKSTIRRIPQVSFSGVVFLKTENDVDQFAEILQDIAQQVLIAFSICEVRTYSNA
jgi:hypothetical protein